MSTKTQPRGRGRPELDPADRLVGRSIRLTAAHWDVLRKLGGLRWLRAMLDATVEARAAAKK